MRRLRTHHDLAQGLGKELGIGAVLLRCLPQQEAGDTKNMNRLELNHLQL